MTIATLCARRETTAPLTYKGRSWVIRLNGLIYSKKSAFHKEFPAFVDKDGELVLAIRPDIDETLKETLDNKPLPISLVTSMLKTMGQSGCSVVGSTSGAASDEEIWFIWTLGY